MSGLSSDTELKFDLNFSLGFLNEPVLQFKKEENGYIEYY